MRLVCSYCREIYSGEYVKVGKPCPKIDCYKPPLISIDEALIYPILQLWDAELNTEFCCSGHLEDVIFAPYLVFVFDHKPLKFIEQCKKIFYSTEYQKRYKNVHHITVRSEKVEGFLQVEKKLDLQTKFILGLLELAKITQAENEIEEEF